MHKTTAAPLCVALASVSITGAMIELVTFVVIFTTSSLMSRAVAASATKSGANFLGPRSTVGRPGLADALVLGPSFTGLRETPRLDAAPPTRSGDRDVSQYRWQPDKTRFG